MVKEKFYVTTPIYYPNDIPHIGHAYTTVIADVVARWNKLLGKDVYFLTGTDDHGKKIADTAEAAGKSPMEFVDDLIPKFKDAWSKMGIEYDRFIRTTDKDHEKNVQSMLQKSYDNGDIYLGEYEGLYCIGCEQYYTEKDLEDGCCPIHKKPVEKVKEETYFFRLSKYQDKLLELYEKNLEFISPPRRRQEIINRVKEGLRDLSISRTSFDWGVKLPFDKKHVCYVWFDALFNYVSGVDDKSRWPADIHLIGKDIIWFHTVYWPAFLMSVGEELPKKVFAHGWWTFDNEKISKSVGKVINIDELVAITGNKDSARYFLCRATPFGDDGDFSESALVDRHNGELLNKLGNLVSRTTGLIEKYGVEKCESGLVVNFDSINSLMQNLEIDKALNEIFAFIDLCNEYIQEKKPWATQDKKVLYELADAIKNIAILLYPFIPSTSEKIADKFGGFKFTKEGLNLPFDVNIEIKKGEGLFVRIEQEEPEAISQKSGIKKKDKKVNKEKKAEGVMTLGEVTFEDFAKLDLRVAEIKEVEEIEDADKLYKISLDVGENIGARTVCAGIKKYYSKEDLIGRKIVYFANLKPRKMKGVVSEGMLFAASTEDDSQVSLINPGEIANGSQVS
ncbi:MAG: methionine--tRNA ligase [Nanoarchaeota archaeon]|jgi:methionyl-tRNA synthetase|nr:methionine--tRNA ligase [Nanoarchaeota archaeon]